VGTDSMGKVTVGSAAGACVITFAKTWGASPYCVVTTGAAGDLATGAPWISLGATTTATSLNIAGMATSATKVTPNIGKITFHYYCQGDIE
jgi:hypothetical protein